MATITPAPLSITVEVLTPDQGVHYVTNIDRIRSAVRDHILRVSGVGNVHTFEPKAADASNIPTLFRYNGGPVRAWTIQLERSQPDNLTNQDNTIEHRFVIRGYVEFDDTSGSELLFDRLVELIRQVFRNTLRLDLAGIVERVTEPTFENPTPRMLGGAILVHYGELRLRVQELDERSPTP